MEVEETFEEVPHKWVKLSTDKLEHLMDTTYESGEDFFQKGFNLSLKRLKKKAAIKLKL